MSADLVIRFDTDNGVASATYIHTDALDPRELAASVGGKLATKRASHVEPDDECPGEWVVDLGPVYGPVQRGFTTRRAALDWEVEWLLKHRIET